MRPEKTWTIKDLLHVTADYLKEKHIESPRLTAELLLAHQLNVDRVNLYLNFEQPLTGKEVTGYRSLIKRRLLREPLQYITGVQEFWSLDFKVDSRVLIPRPESELLVELAVGKMKSLPLERHPARILDLGTGCGALAVSLAKEVTEAQIWATDISAGSLALARLNAERHQVLDHLEFRQGNLWAPLENQGITFDIIVTNPPYVAPEEYNKLLPEVRDYEPRLALDGKERGMSFIEKIILGAPDFLSPGGWIMIEMAPRQTEEALGLMEQLKGYEKKARIKDYSGNYRVVMAQKGLSGSQ
jgi:release factor glutamine methyltransferase